MRKSPETALTTLARLREREEREFAERLGAAHRRLEQERRNLTTVEGYLAEYAVRKTDAGMPQLFREAHRFRLKLELSVDQQRAAVERARLQAESARTQWAEARSRREAVTKLLDRHCDSSLRRAIRAEQRHSDELAGRRGGKLPPER